MVFAQLGDRSGLSDPSALDNIRLAIADAWGTNSNVLRGPVLYDIAGLHYTSDADAQTVANRWWSALSETFYAGASGSSHGPILQSIGFSGSKDKLLLNFSVPTTPITLSSGTSGFRVTDNGVAATISSTAVSGNSNILLNLSAPTTGTVLVSLGSQEDGAGNAVPKSSGTYTLPADTFIGYTVPNFPTVTTSPATATSTTGATLNGSITADGNASSTIRGFAWGTNSNLSGGDTATTTDTVGAPFNLGSFTKALTGLTPNTTYYFRTYAFNSAGTSTGSIVSFATNDITSPIVNMTIPTGGTTLAGSSVALFATATDNVGVVGVQFMLDGVTNINAEVTSTSSPNTYTTTWNSTGITSYGSHTLYAVARDAAGNHSTSTVTVNVDNVAPTLVSAVYNSDTQVTVTLSKLANAGSITKSNDGGFTVTKTGTSTTYAVISIAPGSDNTKVVLTIANMNTAGGTGVKVTYSHSGNGTIADTLGNLLVTDNTGITIPPWNTTAPIISNITSTVSNGDYKLGSAIDVDLTFSKSVNTTGNVVVTLNTGGTCSFSGISNSTTASCTYTVGSGENTSALNVTSVAGTIISTDSNPMTSFTPILNLSANKNIVIDTTISITPVAPVVTTSVSSGGGGSASSQVTNLIAMGNYTLAQQIAKQYGILIPLKKFLAQNISANTNTPESNLGDSFTRTLKIGMTNNDVKQLQAFLNTHGFPIAKSGAGSPGRETNYFGPATKAALMKFQLAYKKETLDPQGLRSPTGFFGMYTMKAVNKLLK